MPADGAVVELLPRRVPITSRTRSSPTITLRRNQRRATPSGENCSSCSAPTGTLADVARPQDHALQHRRRRARCVAMGRSAGGCSGSGRLEASGASCAAASTFAASAEESCASVAAVSSKSASWDMVLILIYLALQAFAAIGTDELCVFRQFVSKLRAEASTNAKVNGAPKLELACRHTRANGSARLPRRRRAPARDTKQVPPIRADCRGRAA